MARKEGLDRTVDYGRKVGLEGTVDYGESEIFKIRYSIISLMMLVGIAIVAFHFLEGWSYFDSAYFATTAITTMGSNMMPQTNAGKLFTIVYLWGGVGLGFYTLMRLAKTQSTAVESEIQKFTKIFFRRKRKGL